MLTGGALAEVCRITVGKKVPAEKRGDQMALNDEAIADSKLRRLRRRRGLTLEVLAHRSGLSKGFLSMVERGQCELKRFDHVNALASALRVAPSDLAPVTFQGSGEWMPAALPAVSAFPAACDRITMTRHAAMADQLMGYMSRGDGCAAGKWLRRIARDPGVSPWLLLDQLAAHRQETEGKRKPGRYSGQRHGSTDLDPPALRFAGGVGRKP
jgi:transcriptional regulator with XRE-family HTH domain